MRTASIIFALAALCSCVLSLRAQETNNTNWPPKTLAKEEVRPFVLKLKPLGSWGKLDVGGNKVLVITHYGKDVSLKVNGVETLEPSSSMVIPEIFVYVLRGDEYLLVRNCPPSPTEGVTPQLHNDDLIIQTVKSKNILCTITSDEIQKVLENQK